MVADVDLPTIAEMSGVNNTSVKIHCDFFPLKLTPVPLGDKVLTAFQ